MSEKNTHKFDDNIKEGDIKEVEDFFYKAMCNYFDTSEKKIAKIKYEKGKQHRDLQNRGVDYVLYDRRKKKHYIEKKSRFRFPENYKFNDIGWEVKHTYDKEGLKFKKYGWGVMDDCLTDFLVWIYWSSSMRKLLIIDFDKAKEYYKSIEYTISNDNMLRSNTRDSENNIVHYTWSCYININNIMDSVLASYILIDNKLKRMRRPI